MKRKTLKMFLSGTVFFLFAAGTAVQAAQPYDAQDIYAAAGDTIYRIDARTGDFEEEGQCYDPVRDVMKTENGLYGRTGDNEDRGLDLRVFSDGDDSYIDYDVTDMVGECDGKFYYLKDSIVSGQGLYVYDPDSDENEKAISPEVICAETDGETLYASVLLKDNAHPDGVCRISFGPKDNGKWSALKEPEEGAEYLPEIVKGKDGVYFLYRMPETEEETVYISLLKIEYAEPHECITVAAFTIPKEGKVRLAGCTEAMTVIEYWDDSKREAHILREEDGTALQFGILDMEEEFPPIFSAGDDFYTIFGENDIYLVDTEANGEIVMSLPAEAKLRGISGGKAVYSLNGSLFWADAEDAAEENSTDVQEVLPEQAGEELSKALSDYLEEAQRPSVFYKKLMEDPLTAAILQETEENFVITADLQIGSGGEEFPVSAEIRTEREENGFKVGGTISAELEEEAENVEFALDPGSGKLEISVDGQKKSLDFSSLQTMAESFLSGLPEEKKAETFDAETIMRFLDNREILTEEGVHSYVDYSKGEREDISEPCTVYKLKIGWDEVSDYLSLVTDQIEDLYTSFRDFQEELSGYSPSYDTGLNLRENMESMISEIKKYAPEGLELRFSVGEEGLVGASLSARMTEDAAAAYNPDGKKLKTVKIGENQAYAGLLAEADLKRKQLTEADELELIWSLPALITVTAVDAAGDENTEYMNFDLTNTSKSPPSKSAKL